MAWANVAIDSQEDYKYVGLGNALDQIVKRHRNSKTTTTWACTKAHYPLLTACCRFSGHFPRKQTELKETLLSLAPQPGIHITIETREKESSELFKRWLFARVSI